VADREMQAWRDAWSGNDASDAGTTQIDVAKLLRRHRLFAALRLAGNVAFGIVLLAGSFVFAERTGDPEMIFWAVAVWIATLVTLAIALKAWRRDQLYNTETVAGFTGFYRKKASSDRWKARTGVSLLAVLFAVSAAWLTVDLLSSRMSLSRYAIVLAVEIAICVIWAAAFAHMWRMADSVLKRTSVDESGPGF
jgi:hypothetical protein